MERYEMAELLAKKAGVSLEEAKNALERNGWDMLDAMIELERARNKSRTIDVDPAAGPEWDKQQAPRPVKNVSQKEPFFTNGFRVIWGYIKRLGKMSVTNDFVAIRRGKQIFRVPVLVMLILAVCFFWFTIPVLIIALFCGVTYRFEGKELGKDAVNKAMENVSGVAEDIKEAFRQDGHDSQE